MNKSLDFATKVSILRYLSRSDGNYQIKRESASIHFTVIEGTGVGDGISCVGIKTLRRDVRRLYFNVNVNENSEISKI